ncbi:hypothetical protein PS627_01563 [Pseudomonas fluorescens]|uniref:hypothetical protein n=1 Tax=Pseudomonas fluorescens TaxID=294 RepID=UPI0012560D2D|nr:hypothetical protein [Pseudomonas fluorescens]CAG8865644.1 hypothetical protein PS627_01563 [Pseudomonas fluorescens]VVP86972.1 hypothetical protein PS910_02504 [Pseudomonas fluorescens]
MKPTTKTETELDSEAARRALDFYLNPPTSLPQPDDFLWVLRDDVTQEQANAHAASLLRWTATTAYESGRHMQDSSREVVFTLLQMVNMVRTLLEHRPTGDDKADSRSP